MSERTRRGLSFIARLGPAGLLLVSVLVGCVAPPEGGQRTDAVDVAVEPLELPTPAAESVMRRAQQMTLRIRSLGCSQLSLGSGFVLGDGLVVTNRHVLGQPLQVTVNTWDGRSLEARVTGVARDSDLGVLQLDEFDGLPAAQLRTDQVEVGEPVYAVGYPGGGAVSVSDGEVVGFSSGRLLGEPADVIRVDARIEQGSSGGPLLDADGLVIGVMFALETGDRTGLAVPVETLRDRLDEAELSEPEGC